MKVLVTFALASEFAPWRKMRDFREAPRAAGAQPWAPSLFETRIGSARVHVVLTGMGSEPARASARLALLEPYDICIASGLAGSLRPVYAPGDILAARAVQEQQGRRVVTCDAELVESARECGATVCDKFLTSRKLITDATEKLRLGRLGDAVDMESFSVLAASSGRGIRSVVIRAVSDGVDMDMPLDFMRTLDPRGAIRMGRVMSHVVRRPGRLPGLVRLGRQSVRAATRLAAFLDRFVLEGANTDFRLLAKVAAG
jgi:nucleoside phosphorylase